MVLRLAAVLLPERHSHRYPAQAEQRAEPNVKQAGFEDGAAVGRPPGLPTRGRPDDMPARGAKNVRVRGGRAYEFDGFARLYFIYSRAW